MTRAMKKRIVGTDRRSTLQRRGDVLSSPGPLTTLDGGLVPDGQSPEEVDAGPSRDTADLTELLDAFVNHLETCRKSSPLTVSAYRRDALSFLDWCRRQGLTPLLSDLSHPLLVNYLDSLPGLSANTVRRRAHALGAWFKWLVGKGLLDENPARELPLPHRVRRLPAFPSSQQSEGLLAAARSPLEKAVVWLLLTAGLRRAELLGLDLGDVSPGCDEIRVRGKGNRERLVPLPEQTQAVLREYLGIRDRDPGPLLFNRAGNRLGVTSLRRLFRRLVRRAGLEDERYSIHSMRHGYATMLLRAGVDLGTIRDLLGHSDISVTSVYLHTDLRSKRDAVERLPVLREGGEHRG